MTSFADMKALLVINKVEEDTFEVDKELKKFNPILISLKKELNIDREKNQYN